MICIRCHRPLKFPSPTGMGRVCASKSAPPPPAHERDLFGYDLDKAHAAALHQVKVCAETAAAALHMAIKHEFAAARRAFGVWA